MATVLRICGALAVFIGAAGFLFGQLFAGEFSPGGTLAGICGVAAGGLAFSTMGRHLRTTALIACGIGLVGAGLHVLEYYAVDHVPGNYYAWFLTAPFAAALLIIAVHAAGRR